MRLPLLASILVLLSTPAWAQEASCISTPTQLVASMPNDDVGDSFAIYHKSNPTQVIPCRFDRDAADLVIEGWYALEALMGDYLERPAVCDRNRPAGQINVDRTAVIQLNPFIVSRRVTAIEELVDDDTLDRSGREDQKNGH